MKILENYFFTQVGDYQRLDNIAFVATNQAEKYGIYFIYLFIWVGGIMNI